MRIVVATFGAAGGVGALDYAADVVDDPDDELLVVHAVSGEDDPGEESGNGDPASHGRAMLDRAERYAEDAGVAVETTLLWGPPTESIPRYVDDRGADLLVVGRPRSARRTGTSTTIRWIVGKVAAPASIVPASHSAERADEESRRGDHSR